MNFLRWFSLFVVLLTPICASPQSGSKIDSQAAVEVAKEKELKLTVLADQILADIQVFKRGANRAYLSAKAGNFICKADPAHAAKLLQTSIDELINAQMLAETERKPNQPLDELLTSQITRPNTLITIARCDANLALQGFYQTRPAVVEKAMSSQSEKPTKISNNNNGNNANFAQNELNLEQKLMQFAASQNPDRAAALLKESLKRGLTVETFGLLQKVNTKDPDEAGRLAAEVLDTIIQKGFTTNGQPDAGAFNTAYAFLSEFTRTKSDTEKVLKIDGSQVRTMAEKLFTAYLEPTANTGYFQAPTLIQYAEKLSPGYVSRIKAQEKIVIQRDGGFRPGSTNSDIGILLNSNPTTEKLMAEAKNFPLDSRRPIYAAAANKLAEKDDFAAAHALLNENFSDDALVNAQESLNWYYVHRLINQGKCTEAERMMTDFPESNRNAALIDLALVMFEKDKVENKAPATAVLDKVRMLMPERPANQNEMGQLMRLVSAYSRIDPRQAFDMVESFVPQINAITDASILVTSFQGGGYNMQQGEFLIGYGLPFNAYLDPSIIRVLADKNFDRTTKFLDGFSRAEMRLSLKLQLADNIFSQH